MLLTNCHLHKSGLATFPCDVDSSSSSIIADCTRRLGQDVVAFQTYNIFFTHADNICFYVQHQEFVERSEHAVNGLFSSVLLTADHLDRFHNDALSWHEEMTQRMNQHQADWQQRLKTFSDEEKSRFSALRDAGEALMRVQLDWHSAQNKQHNEVSRYFADYCNEMFG